MIKRKITIISIISLMSVSLMGCQNEDNKNETTEQVTTTTEEIIQEDLNVEEHNSLESIYNVDKDEWPITSER